MVLWAMAAAMVPAMQKGDDNARTVHITLNCLNLALFAWQVLLPLVALLLSQKNIVLI